MDEDTKLVEQLARALLDGPIPWEALCESGQKALLNHARLKIKEMIALELADNT